VRIFFLLVEHVATFHESFFGGGFTFRDFKFYNYFKTIIAPQPMSHLNQASSRPPTFTSHSTNNSLPFFPHQGPASSPPEASHSTNNSIPFLTWSRLPLNHNSLPFLTWSRLPLRLQVLIVPSVSSGEPTGVLRQRRLPAPVAAANLGNPSIK
jgi:hypothetical protein